MTEYWKSLEKKYCDVCKCWLSDNKASIQFHENGKRHQESVQNKLREIQKKTRVQEKEDRKTNKSLKRIEEAATAAYCLDRSVNPDISLRMDMMREEAIASNPEIAAMVKEAEEEEAKKKASFQPKILHREDNPSKRSKPTSTAAYTSKGGWTDMGHQKGGLDLELPPKNIPFRFNPPKEVRVKSGLQFQEGSLVSKDKPLAATSSFSSQQSDGGGQEVSFKKRKIARSNMRQRDGDD